MLRCGQETAWLDQFSVFVAQPEEQLDTGIMWLIIVQRANFLREQAQALFIETDPDPLYPRHLADALNQFRLAGMIALNTIAAFLLRRITSQIGRPQSLHHRAGI